MESKKISQLATELSPDLSDLTIIGDPTTGISKKITLSQMASLFTGTVEEYATLAAFPLVGVADTIYIALDTNIIYRYDTSLSTYVVLSPNIINSLVFSDANGFDGTITLVGSVATLSITTALTLGSVPFIGASGALTQDNSNLFFDDTNNRLGIATALPTTPLDVFGSGIIGRLNATSTNNAFLGFASNGTNKWSAGNVQSDHRFRIFSEANSAELITILQTGEFGIGIANPLTKFHIDGGATALIANLDANVSVAKSVSFRSDNSSRINLEVSGTESGSNAGADFFLRTFTDAGSLLATPLTIVRSTSAATFVSSVTATALIPTGATIPSNGMYLSAANTLNFATNTTNRITITSAGFVGIGNDSPNAPLIVQGTLLGGLFSLVLNDTAAIAANIGGGIAFGGNYTGTTKTEWAGILGRKDNATDGEYGGYMSFYTRTNGTSPSERMRITSAGNVGIATTTINGLLSLKAENTNTPTIVFQPTGSQAPSAISNFLGANQTFTVIGSNAYVNSAGSITRFNSSYAGCYIAFDEGEIGFGVGTSGGNPSQKMRITTAGNVGIGTSSPNTKFNVVGDGTPSWTATANNIACFSQTATSGSVARVSIVSGNAGVSGLDFGDTDRDNDAGIFYNNSTQAMTFTTAAVNNRMTITSGGDFLVAQTSSNIATTGSAILSSGRIRICTDNNEPMEINRKTSDGKLIIFYQDTVEEGSISVSGSTVSYNGGHLARFTQTESNQRIEGLLKGTVMSNLDKMAEWINSETGEPYPNEQLNCMKVSDIEGDINIAGVFVNYDNDNINESNDMNIAMTGDMIIRIAKGVIVEKGQLLMSAGNGTAKPQEDDIIRAKTIAKVTSNHITCTYEDDSYCVPCVLMAC